MPNYTPETDLGWRGVVYPAGRPCIIPDDLAAVLGVGAAPTDDAPTPPEAPPTPSADHQTRSQPKQRRRPAPGGSQ